METPADRIANALERIATILESGAHINIDHGHDNQDLGDKGMADIDDMYYHHFSEINKSDER